MKNNYFTDSQSSILFPQMDITFADFFCGCGGLSLGFIQAGLKCVAAMDIAPDALWTYWYNLCYKGWSHLWVDPNNPILATKKYGLLKDNKTSNFLFPKGIPDNWLSPEIKDPMPCLNLFMYSIMDMEPEQWMEICQVRPGDIKIFAGGPPCQGFSSCNSSRHILDERNQLPMRFIYYAKVCKPKIIFMENVPGILSLGKKKGDNEGPFPIWLREKFDDAGYDMEYNVINAKDFGVPQSRKRVIFFATRKGDEKLKHPEATHGKGKEPYVTTRETIGDLPPIGDGVHWGKDVLHPYGYNSEAGHVICPVCLKYNKIERNFCHNCGGELSNPIRGGVLVFPGIGEMIDCQKPIDNKKLKKISILPETIGQENI